MKRLLLIALLMTIGWFAAAVPGAAQAAMNEGQGHPLKGVWIGDWGTDANSRHPVLIELNWDGKAVTGRMNPGPEEIRFTRAELNHDNWTVRLEAEAGGVRYEINGAIADLGLPNRSISGTWVQGNQRGDFKITRH
jgi:hypothetical protein